MVNGREEDIDPWGTTVSSLIAGDGAMAVMANCCVKCISSRMALSTLPSRDYIMVTVILNLF